MNEEIKEILEQLDIVVNRPLPMLILAPEYTKILLDYITSLQQENERLNYQLEVQKELTERNRLRKHCYKSRCEKAVEYIEKEKSNYMRSCGISNATNREGLIISSAVRTCDDTLNILNGRSDE